MPKTTGLQQLREQEKASRRQLILDAAMDLFSKRHFKQVNMREIAREAGISPALIYRHFDTQEELFLAVIEQHYHQFFDYEYQRLQKKPSSEGNAELQRFVKRYLDLNSEHQSFFKMMTLFGLGTELSAENILRYQATERRVVDLIEQLFNRARPKQENRLLAHALQSSLHGILISFLNYPNETVAKRRRHMRRLAALILEKLLLKELN